MQNQTSLSLSLFLSALSLVLNFENAFHSKVTPYWCLWTGFSGRIYLKYFLKINEGKTVWELATTSQSRDVLALLAFDISYFM